MRHRNNMEDKMRATIKNTAPIAINGLRPGGERDIETDRAGTPLDKVWRRRVADGKRDKVIIVTKMDKDLTAAIKVDKGDK